MSFFSVDMRVLRSFISVVETGSVTETARRLGRTQPAITLQMKRLEDLTGKILFRQDSRRPVLTEQGDLVLSYAKSILRLHDELLTKLSSPDIEGHVVLGTPDLYAAYLLPSILALFRKSFPRIQVELRCSLRSTTRASMSSSPVWQFTMFPPRLNALRPSERSRASCVPAVVSRCSTSPT